MKAIKIVSFILIIATLCCGFISCDQGAAGDASLPDRELYEVTVSFQIKDDSGKTELEAVNYKYKGHAEPTMLNVLNSYLSIVAEYVCKIDKTNTLVQIGGMKANTRDGDYWGFVMSKKDEAGNIVKSPFTLDLKQIKESLSEGKMADTRLENGDEFVVILIKSED